MRSSLMLAALLALVAVGPVGAQNIQVEVQGQNVQVVPAFGNAGPLLTADAIEQLKLNAEQKDKFAKIETEYKEKQKTASDKLRQAFQDKDRKAIQEASQESAKLRTDTLAKVEALLSEEQKKTFEQVKQPRIRPFGGAGGVGGAVLPPAIQERLKLTDEQKKKVEELQKELEAKILGVLTEEQKKQYEEMKKNSAARPGGVIQLRLQ